MYERRKDDATLHADLPYFCKALSSKSSFIASLQLLISVMLLYYGSKGLVASVDEIASKLGISPLGLALVIVPAATAIPETASALIWGYRGRDTLCLGSLVGEKILYSTFYPGIAMIMTSWKLDIHAYLSVITTTVVSLVLLYYISKERVPWYGLCFGLVFFIGYSVLVFTLHF